MACHLVLACEHQAGSFCLAKTAFSSTSILNQPVLPRNVVISVRYLLLLRY
jgi:hypothetical protein